MSKTYLENFTVDHIWEHGNEERDRPPHWAEKRIYSENVVPNSIQRIRLIQFTITTQFLPLKLIQVFIW